MAGGGGGGGEWTGVVSDPGPSVSSLGTGIILPSEPSPHWRVSRLGFSFRLGLGITGIPFLVWQAVSLGNLAVH